MKIRLDNIDGPVEYFPYRSAIVKGPLEIKYEAENREKFLKLQEKLCKKVTKVYGSTISLENVEPTNHTCFKIGGIYMMFSDWKVYIGSEIILGDW